MKVQTKSIHLASLDSCTCILIFFILMDYCRIWKFLRGFIFRETRHLRSFVKIKPSQNMKSLSFNDVGKSCSGREFLTSQMCLLMRLAKISEFTVSNTY